MGARKQPERKPGLAKEKRLSGKPLRFVSEYLVDLNATRAAERAGYSAKTAYSQGHELLKKPEVASAISEAQQQRGQRTEVTADRVVLELALIAFADIGDVIKVDPETGKVSVRALDTLSPESRRAIGEITQNTTEHTEHGSDGSPSTLVEKVRLGVKHHSKVRALELLMDHLGMKAPQKLEHTLGATELRGALERLRARNGTG